MIDLPTIPRMEGEREWRERGGCGEGMRMHTHTHTHTHTSITGTTDPSHADRELLPAAGALQHVLVTLPPPLALSGLHHLQRLVLPPQLLQGSLQLLDLPLEAGVLLHHRPSLLLLVHKPAGICTVGV